MTWNTDVRDLEYGFHGAAGKLFKNYTLINRVGCRYTYSELEQIHHEDTKAMMNGMSDILDSRPYPCFQLRRAA